MISLPLEILRQAIALACRCDESVRVAALVAEMASRAPDRERVAGSARRLLEALRRAQRDAGGVARLMHLFPLASPEGIALMGLAEALLRIPDPATAERLLRDKLGRRDWSARPEGDDASFAAAVAQGLRLAGEWLDAEAEAPAHRFAQRLALAGVRRGAAWAMTYLGQQFVLAESIEAALARGRAGERRGYAYSFDMLGEAALTTADAERYGRAYEHAIEAIGQAAGGRGVYAGPGISVKLSALHPRYVRSQAERVRGELLPRLRALARLARRHGLGFTIDAEEAHRLELSLDLFETLALDPELAGWEGLGFVVQAYQKRAPGVIDYLVALARHGGRRFMLRLVKGAYWDSEIKAAQGAGLDDYPVYTRKAHTDLAYLACAARLLEAPDAVHGQFATHNAHTVAAVMEMARDRGVADYEFQCLHGMGEPLYDQVLAADPGRRCRIYAPVGSHATLLPYLVRRLLENGANSSFVHRLVDASVSLDELLADPLETVRREGGRPHPAIPRPEALFGPGRRNSAGLDLDDPGTLARLGESLESLAQRHGEARPVLASTPLPAAAGGPPAPHSATAGAPAGAEPHSAHAGKDSHRDSPRPPAGTFSRDAEARGWGDVKTALPLPITNPADRTDEVGTVLETSPAEVEAALAAADAFAPHWHALPRAERAALLLRAADRLEARRNDFVSLCRREAGKTWPNGVAEVREAVDFCRYYAQQLLLLEPAPGPRPPGPVACISPWNFPLAIFVGQIAAALAAGSPVLAKPAEETPLIAALAVRLFHEAGIPPAALQFLPGRGETVGAALTADPRLRGVIFTGSTAVARHIQRKLAHAAGPGDPLAHLPTPPQPIAAASPPGTPPENRMNTGSTSDDPAREAAGVGIPAPREIRLIAETGGQNALLVDSSALPEQVVQDVLVSAFDSAGQRCSALRLLCLQEEIADTLLALLKGALAELRIGDPRHLSTDIGPVIGEAARAGLESHIAAMRAAGRAVFQLPLPISCAAGHFVPPTLIEIEAVAELSGEVFGPVLHVLRFQRERMAELIDALNATGYGLTFGLHSRIERTVDEALARVRAGNSYINRNLIGAVVGVQPFGGEGLSGTGPKAGGPLYLHRLLETENLPPRALGLPSETACAPPPLAPPHPDARGGKPHALPQPGATGAETPPFPAPPAGGGGLSPAFQSLAAWARESGRADLAEACAAYAGFTLLPHRFRLPGPTGESNILHFAPRGPVLCVAAMESALLEQIAACLASGNRIFLEPGAQAATLLAQLPGQVGEQASLLPNPAEAPLAAALCAAGPEIAARLQKALAERPGPLVPVIFPGPESGRYPLYRLVAERVVTRNTAAAGGNAGLLGLAP